MGDFVGSENITDGSSAYGAVAGVSLHSQSTGIAGTEVTTAVKHCIRLSLQTYDTLSLIGSSTPMYRAIGRRCTRSL